MMGACSGTADGLIRLGKVVGVSAQSVTATYVGQVEEDPDGLLWAVLYHGTTVIAREQVQTLRKGKRRVADLVLAAADTFPAGPRKPVPTQLNRLVSEQRVPAKRHRRAGRVATVG